MSTRGRCVDRSTEQPAGGLQPVHDRHPHVHQHHVRVELAGGGHRLRAVGGVADHQQVRLGGEQRAEALPDHRLVVGDQHPDHRVPALRVVRQLGRHRVTPVGQSARR